MKKLLLALLFITSFTIANAQLTKEFDDRYNHLLTALGAEDWKTAEKESRELLTKISKIDDMDKEKRALRYLIIYSTAGLMNEKKLSKEKALKKVKEFKGHELMMAGHPVIDSCYVNCTWLASERKNTFFSGVNNAAGTQIFAFEYTEMKEPVDSISIKKIEGKIVSLRGKLTDIQVEGNMLPRFRIEVSEGEMEVWEE